MLIQIAQFLLETAFGLLVFVLLARFYMQATRVSFRNPIGEFATALTNWLVLPARRVVPGLYGYDLASLVCAWLVECLMVLLILMLRGHAFDSGAAIMMLAALGLLRLAVAAIQLGMGIVIVQFVISLVSPHAPLAPLFNALARPMLRPFQRIIPLVGNVDLSPAVFLILAQIVLFVLAPYYLL